MTKKPPSPRERETLLFIYHYTNEQGDAPTSQDIANELGITLKYALTIVGRLEKKELVKRVETKVLLVMKNVEEFLVGLELPVRPLSVVPTQILIRGEVRAGKADTEIILDEGRENTVRIPDSRLDRDTFLLRVVGRSMEHENIYDGDYIIVENYVGLEKPNVGDIIVTRYIEDIPDETIEISPDDFSGLTVKVYSGEIYRGNTILYKLSWKKDKVFNPYTIIARGLIPVGRVIGVYRDMQKK